MGPRRGAGTGAGPSGGALPAASTAGAGRPPPLTGDKAKPRQPQWEKGGYGRGMHASPPPPATLGKTGLEPVLTPVIWLFPFIQIISI